MSQVVATMSRLSRPVSRRERDDALAASVRSYLWRSGYPALRAVSVLVEDENVELSGIVPSYFMIQQAQSVAASVPGIHAIHNKMKVVRSPAYSTN